MGQSSSSILPSADPRVPYFSLTFQTPDKIVLSLADDHVIDLTRSAIVESSSSSADADAGNEASADDDTFIHYERRTEMNAYVFKLRGLPFMRGCGRASSFRASRMCCRLLEMYNEHGWRLTLSSDLSRAKELTTWFFCRRTTTPVVENVTPNSNSTKDESADEGSSGNLFLRKNDWDDEENGGEKEILEVEESEPSAAPVRNRKRTTSSRVICVSTSSSDLLRLANGSERTWSLLSEAVRKGYLVNGVKYERVYDGGDYEVQLADTPWMHQDLALCIRTRRLLLEIIRRFETVGYKLYGTANTKGTSDSLFFISSCSNGGSESSSAEIPLGPSRSNNKNTNCYFALSLNYTNCLRVIDAPPYVVKSVLRAIVTYWPPNLKKLTPLEGDENAYEFKLRGNPWSGVKGEEATAARVFLCGLFRTMASLGWEPLTALDVTRRVNDKAVIIFRSASSKGDEVETAEDRAAALPALNRSPYWCLSMQNQSTVGFILAPEYLRGGLRHTIEQIWPWGVQAESELDGFKDSYEFKLRGGPWGAEEPNITALMCCILKTLNDRGHQVVLSADVTGRFVSNNHGGAHSLDVHSWFLTDTTSRANFFERDAQKKLIAAKPSQPKVKLPRRGSLPLMTRSATFTDEFLVPMLQMKINSSITHPPPPAPLHENDKQKQQQKKVQRKSSAARLLRKISTLTEYGNGR